MDQASILRQEQLLKPQSLQSASLDGGARYFSWISNVIKLELDMHVACSDCHLLVISIFAQSTGKFILAFTTLDLLIMVIVCALLS
jgi:hypothetical protein